MVFLAYLGKQMNQLITLGDLSPVLLRMTADRGVYNADINGAVEGYNGQ